MEVSNRDTNSFDLQATIDSMVESHRKYANNGELASYIPELLKADKNALGMVIIDSNGRKFASGDIRDTFSIQSISKVFAFIVACMQHGIPRVLERVDVEPTGEPFNSIFHLELKKSKPLNPLVNTGAITVSSMLQGGTSTEKLAGLLDLLEEIIGRRPEVMQDVYESEAATATRNRGIAYLLLESGALEADVDLTLDTYFKQCALGVTVEDLAKLGLVLANDGLEPLTGKNIIPKKIAKLAKALMVTCGMYDASGRFAAKVGIPAKSGVAGGILATVPPRAVKDFPFANGCGIGIYGPALDEQGNSAAGVELLRHMAERWDWSIF